MVDSSNEIPSYFTNRIKAAKELQLTELDLSAPNNNYKLDHIPDAVFELTQLEKLKLKGNCLSELPESIGNLTNLSSLELRFRQNSD